MKIYRQRNKEYKITYILDGNQIAEKTMHYNDVLTDPGVPDESEGLHFEGLEWWSGSDKLENFQKDKGTAKKLSFLRSPFMIFNCFFDLE